MFSMTVGGRDRPTLTFDPETGEYTTPIDGESAVLAIVLSLAIVGGVDATEIEPVATTVDPDLVESFVESLSDGTIELDGQFAFEHDGYRVAIDGDGVLHVDVLPDA